MTIIQILDWGAQELKKTKIKSALLDAEILLLDVLNKSFIRRKAQSIFPNPMLSKEQKISKAWMYAHPEYAISRRQLAKYKEYISRRARHEPVAYIIGYKEFYGFNFYVNKNVLVPRPESELLVDETLKLVPRYSASGCQRINILEIGTGSGCIIISILKKLQITNCELKIASTAIDIFKKALKVAEKNAQLHKVNRKIKFIQSNLLSNVKSLNADIVIANLPYLSKERRNKLSKDISFEPASALFAGQNGLQLIDKLLKQISVLLKINYARARDKQPLAKEKSKFILLEIGYGQKDKIRSKIKKNFTNVKIKFIKDLLGIDRVAIVEI